ncbi:MAG: hypothetical protein JWP29_192 [Rhodoferax sp.]|nr:hypothetical protein [Rhodoferax sp.]
MPLEFLSRMAHSALPHIVADPVEMRLLKACASAGYLEMRPLAIKGGSPPQLVAARVMAVLPEGARALHCLTA